MNSTLSVTSTLVFFLNLRGLASRAFRALFFLLAIVVPSEIESIEWCGGDRSERLFVAVDRVGRTGRAAATATAATTAGGGVAADALDLGLRPAQARAELVGDDLDDVALLAVRVSYSRCCRRPVTTTRLPLLRLAAAFSPRSPQATMLKNDTCSCHSPFDLIAAVDGEAEAGDATTTGRVAQLGIAREVADQRDAVL